MPLKQITSSKVHPGTQMKEGEWRFAARPRRLFHNYFGVLHEFWSGEPLFVDGSNRMKKGSVLYIDEIRALGSGGLTLADDSGTLGIFVEDGGQVAVGHSVPTATFHVQNSLDVAEVNIFKMEGKRLTPTNNDTMFILYSMNNDNSDSFEYARTTITAEDITDGAEEGSLLFEVARGGSFDLCLKMSATEIVVNEAGADRDLRVEAVGAANALFVQGSDGNVGIGTATPGAKVHVSGGDIRLDNTYAINALNSIANVASLVELTSGNWTHIADSLNTNGFWIGYRNGVNACAIKGDANAKSMSLYTDNAVRMFVKSDGKVGIGTASPNQLLTVENSMSLKEIAAANADAAGYGQLWCKDNAGTTELWFTDDAGTDTQIV